MACNFQENLQVTIRKKVYTFFWVFRINMFDIALLRSLGEIVIILWSQVWSNWSDGLGWDWEFPMPSLLAASLVWIFTSTVACSFPCKSRHVLFFYSSFGLLIFFLICLKTSICVIMHKHIIDIVPYSFENLNENNQQSFMIHSLLVFRFVD